MPLEASIGLAIPREETDYGYLAELSGSEQDERAIAEQVEAMAAEMLATSLGLDISEKAFEDDPEKYCRLHDISITTTNITQTARGDKDGMWTTVVAAAVFVGD